MCQLYLHPILPEGCGSGFGSNKEDKYVTVSDLFCFMNAKPIVKNPLEIAEWKTKEEAQEAIEDLKRQGFLEDFYDLDYGYHLIIVEDFNYWGEDGFVNSFQETPVEMDVDDGIWVKVHIHELPSGPPDS